MNKSFKFSVAMLFMLTTPLSGCIFPGEWRDRGGDHGDRGNDHGDRGGYHGDHGGDQEESR